MIPRTLVFLAITVVAFLLIDDLTPQRTTNTLPIKIVAVDRDAQTVRILFPVVNSVELVGRIEHLDALVKLQVGEWGSGKLVSGKLNTTKRSLVIVTMDKWAEVEERVVIEQVILK